MEHFRLRKYRGPEVWARVREAYVAGEPGAQVAARFDVSVANLRKKASREGWTRNQAARTRDPLILATQPAIMGEPDAPTAGSDPADAFEAALARAATAIAAGRGAEAASLLKAAETLVRLRQATPPEHLPTPEEWEAEEEARRVARSEEMAAWREAETARLEEQWGRRALKMAHALLTDRGHDLADNWAISALRWRAENLGPDQALADFARGVSGGWAAHYWDEHGRLKPVEPPPMPCSQMWRQHVRSNRGRVGGEVDMTGVEWPPKGIGVTDEIPAADPVPTSEAQSGPRARRL